MVYSIYSKSGGVKNPNKSPMKFSVSLDGRNGWYYYCQAMNASRCQSVSDKQLNKQCERKNKVSNVKFLLEEALNGETELLKIIKLNYKNLTPEKN